MTAIVQWAKAHPELVSAFAWPILSAVVTGLFKPRTKSEYDVLILSYPRLAKWLQAIGALGVDVPRILDLLRPKSVPPPPPPPTPTVIIANMRSGQ